MSDVGTLAWARATGGALRRRDRADQLWRALLGRLATLPRPGRRPLRLDRDRLLGVELPERAPDSAIAILADERCRDASSAGLYRHCRRTWLWANLLAQVDGIAHDPEVLFVASMLHDLGLTPPYRHVNPAAHCFAVEGAFAAENLLRGHGWPATRAGAAAEAIAFHLNVAVPLARGAEAHLLHAGAALDVIARGASRLPPRLLTAALTAYPREGFATELAELMEAEVAARPRARLALLWQLGFRDLATRSTRLDGRRRDGNDGV